MESFLPFLLSLVFLSARVNGLSRSRRNLVQLAGQLACAHDLSRIEVTNRYVGHGCYCGLGHKGHWPQPVDQTDECCQTHDNCFATVRHKNGFPCSPGLIYLTTYEWECNDKTPKCNPVGTKCADLLCECDRELAECFKQYPINYANEQIRCNKKTYDNDTAKLVS